MATAAAAVAVVACDRFILESYIYIYMYIYALTRICYLMVHRSRNIHWGIEEFHVCRLGCAGGRRDLIR